MKRSFTIVALVLLGCWVSQAQDQRPRFEEKLNEYQNERVAFLTRTLDITPAEAEKFWPIYNEYLKKREEILRDRRHKTQGPPDFDVMSEQDLDKMLKDQLNSEVKLVELKKEYFLKIREVLPAKKTALLYGAEQQFMNHMINRFREMPGEGRGRGKR